MPGEHGIPFLTRDKSRPSISIGVLVEESHHPETLAPRNEIMSFIRERMTCYRFAFGIAATLGGVRLCTAASLPDSTTTWGASVGGIASPWTNPAR